MQSKVKIDPLPAVNSVSTIDLNFPNSPQPKPSYEYVFGILDRPKSKPKASTRCKCTLENFTLLFWERLFETPRDYIVFFSVLLLLSISFIFIGSIYATDCTIRKLLPIFLIVTGVNLGVLMIMGIRRHYREWYKKTTEKSQMIEKRIMCVEGILRLTLILLTVLTSHTVMAVHNGDWVSGPSWDENFCSPVLLYFTFSIFVFVLSFFLLCVLLLILNGLCVPHIINCIKRRLNKR